MERNMNIHYRHPRVKPDQSLSPLTAAKRKAAQVSPRGLRNL